MRSFEFHSLDQPRQFSNSTLPNRSRKPIGGGEHVDRFILAIDQGTTSSRAMLFDEFGSIRGAAQVAIDSTYPRPGWVNQDASEIWRVTLDVARAAIERAGVASSQ